MRVFPQYGPPELVRLRDHRRYHHRSSRAVGHQVNAELTLGRFDRSVDLSGR